MVWRDAPRSSHLDSSAPPMQFGRRHSHSEKRYRFRRMPAHIDRRAPRRRITDGSSSRFQDRGPIANFSCASRFQQKRQNDGSVTVSRKTGSSERRRTAVSTGAGPWFDRLGDGPARGPTGRGAFKFFLAARLNGPAIALRGSPFKTIAKAANICESFPTQPDQMTGPDNRRPTSWPPDTSSMRRWLRSAMPCERMPFRLPRRSKTR